MRLIDAELVEDKIRNLATEIAKDPEQDDDFSTGRWGGLHMALYRIETAPTIDATPVVHGRWVGPTRVDVNNNKYECSKCGFWGVPGWVACPKCGAKMDGGVSDG